VDRLVLLDNSQRLTPFNRQLEFRNGELKFQAEPLRAWARDFLADR